MKTNYISPVTQVFTLEMESSIAQGSSYELLLDLETLGLLEEIQ